MFMCHMPYNNILELNVMLKINEITILIIARFYTVCKCHYWFCLLKKGFKIQFQ